METKVFFKPDCTTCRTVEGILSERGVDADYVRYLEQAPSREDLERVMGLLGTDDPNTIIREKEPIYADLSLENASRDELLDAMASNPILIQRPIVIRGDRAIIARPPERVSELLDD